MRSYTTGKLHRWILSLVMICLMVGSGMTDVFAASYDDPVSVVVPYTHIYDADRNRKNDTFTYRITSLNGAPAPAGTSGSYTFDVKGKPGGEAVSGEVELKIKFDRPGEYQYQVAAANKGRKGFTYESRTYTLHVYVQNDDNGGLKAPLVTAIGKNGRKYQRIQLNPSHESENLPADDARPTTTPRGDGTVPAVVNTAGEPVEEEVVDEPDEPTPLQNIVNKAVPKANPNRHYWALVNLIAAILTVLVSLVLVYRYFERIDTDEDEYIIRRKGNLRLTGLIPSIISVAVFLLTEDLTLPMGLVDEWTLLMIGILVVESILAFIVYRKYDDDDRRAEAEPA